MSVFVQRSLKFSIIFRLLLFCSSWFAFPLWFHVFEILFHAVIGTLLVIIIKVFCISCNGITIRIFYNWRLRVRFRMVCRSRKNSIGLFFNRNVLIFSLNSVIPEFRSNLIGSASKSHSSSLVGICGSIGSGSAFTIALKNCTWISFDILYKSWNALVVSQHTSHTTFGSGSASKI